MNEDASEAEENDLACGKRPDFQEMSVEEFRLPNAKHLFRPNRHLFKESCYNIIKLVTFAMKWVLELYMHVHFKVVKIHDIMMTVVQYDWRLAICVSVSVGNQDQVRHKLRKIYIFIKIFDIFKFTF